MEYHVNSSDTLRSIAVSFNTTTSKLMKMNKMSSSFVFPDQVLMVPEYTSQENDLPEKKRPTSGSSFDGDFAFLAPLSGSPANDDIVKRKLSKEFIFEFNTLKSPIIPNHLPKQELDNQPMDEILRTNRYSPTPTPRKTLTSESGSEKFEENFLKMTASFVNFNQGMVRGVLLVTPTSVMFDPDPKDPLVELEGVEKFGIMCNLACITSATMFTGNFAEKISLKNTVQSSTSEAPKKQQPNIDCSYEDTGINSSNGSESPKAENENQSETKLMNEFPFLFSIVKTVQDFFPETDENEVGEVNLKTSVPKNDEEFVYMCIRSKMPMINTFASLKKLHGACEDQNPTVYGCEDGATLVKGKVNSNNNNKENETKESWFQVQRSRSDQLLAFFIQWSPDPYTLDYAEQNGFVVMNSSVVQQDGNIHSTNDKVCGDTRERSSTNASSLDFIEDFFDDATFDKEWEIVSLEEARRRNLGAIELANEDASIIPELSQKSNLITDDTLLPLCKQLPACAVGYNWKLLYSTYEHGMSLRTLYRKMQVGYDDCPVLLVIKDSDDHIFGAYLSSRPRVSEHFYGTGETFLFKLEPKVEFYEWTGENHFYIKGDINAFTLGGGDGRSGIWIDGDLCHGSSQPCLTFNNPTLSSNHDFFVQGLEMWAIDDA